MIRLSLTLYLLLASAAVAVQPDEQLNDPVLESRARAISGELRCLVCQNQSIDDSDAPLARDLRLLVRKRLQAGDSDNAVRDYLVARYGNFILLKPPLEAETLLLWFTPLLVLLAGGVAALLRFRRVPAESAPLSAGEEEQLERIVAEHRLRPAAPAPTIHP